MMHDVFISFSFKTSLKLSGLSMGCSSDTA